ncbi:uncharacterized protein PITG_23301 [Phytophthora infestans T30-4]|uniref:SWIM-type domain-containing protein n=1 Tax=Phytophthora infestans (strain T30-4) TaxID=403677 RepID=D0N3V2_PHYIT|nr:uncharacterized protein PITG_23301 [Phytophthora infestans T30-4]EEY69056.1 hypothetical protein PITG_23301 [Phytophthora infestans T30-4]|eukprot:XP_002998910.1 hypothetical protein PITG_23301 [Phytophthora infestans T30-4]
MRLMFEQFPEVLLIDATHGTNASKFKVFSFMAHDVFGHGQFVQHALLQNERRHTLVTAIEEFKQNNPAWTRVQSILIDKDVTELSVLRAAFPDASILLCQFHVLKYLREAVASSDYGFTSWQKDQLRSTFNLLVYAPTEAAYLKHRRYLRHLVTFGTQAGSDAHNEAEEECDPNLHAFEAYFTKNWDSCRELWCAYKRQNTVTLGNNTNNRLESAWKQLKEWVDAFMDLDECIASIMYYQSRQERSFNDQVFKVTSVQHTHYDKEMKHVANLVGQHACELIYKQYTFAVAQTSYQYNEVFPGVYAIHSESRSEDALDEPRVSYTVYKNSWTCSCLFMATRLLPCRHVFFIRKDMKMESVIPTQLLNERWLLTTVRSAVNLAELPRAKFAIVSAPEDASSTWDSNRKYREANLIASSISDTMAGFGMKDYQLAMKFFQSVSRIIKHKEFERLLQTETERPTILVSKTTGAGDDVDDCGDCEFGQADIEHTEESLLAVGDHCSKTRTSCVTEEANTHDLADICPTVPNQDQLCPNQDQPCPKQDRLCPI